LNEGHADGGMIVKPPREAQMSLIDQYSHFTGDVYFNVKRHLCFGCRGVDVALVQYLLARAPDAISSLTPDVAQLSNGDCPIKVADVDGDWGSNTDRAMAWFEQALIYPSVLADGAVDPIGSAPISDGDAFLRGDYALYVYKLIVLQRIYTMTNITRYDAGVDTRNDGIGTLAWDGQCPSFLASDPVIARRAHDERG
jgi:hypothetical protein